MLGLRGCRLGISLPAITRMQAQAIMEAALDAGRAVPEIMIPLISDVAELRNQKRVVNEVAKEVFTRRKKKVKYMVGTMIEIPRAALTAGDIAEEAEFFSFGTNDLTQTTFGISRDDSGKFLPLYVSEKILSNDPFVAIDRIGVGRLLRLAVAEGRNTRPGMKIGICGEHGGEPSSVEFCHNSGLDYVSCSPYRLPIARLAAAQAAIAESLANGKKKKKAKSKTASRKKGRRKK
jgi:pyruvate,orthophosphate dikinase